MLIATSKDGFKGDDLTIAMEVMVHPCRVALIAE